MSMRLVPDQKPERIEELFTEYIHQIAPDTVQVTVTPMHGGNAYLADIDAPVYEAASKSVERAFDKKAAFIREGGSIPFVHTITNMLECPAVLLGFGLPDENAHAPNEWLDLENFYLGMETIAYFYEEIVRKL